MILTTKTRYAVIAVIDLIQISNNNPVSLVTISKRQEISLSYLEQIFAKLRRNGIVSAIKGPGGGYILSKKIEEITVADIVTAMGETIKMTRCSTAKQGCVSNGAKCKTHNIWRGLEKNIYQYFQSIAICDMLDFNQKISSK